VTQLAGYVKQQAPEVYADGATANIRATRDGALVTSDLVTTWLREGRVFQTHNPTIGTPITGSAAAAGGHVLTAPSLRLSVPASKVVVPLLLKVMFNAMTGTPNEFAVVATDTDTYSSGGTSVALTAYNMFIDNLGTGQPHNSAVTNLRSGSGSALVEGTLTNPRVLDIGYLARADAVSEPKAQYVWNPVTDGIMPHIHGPASFLVYLSAVTTALTYEFVLMWAELDKAVLVNS
jgi:hypothetical protein